MLYRRFVFGTLLALSGHAKALYDPAPLPDIDPAQGEWIGSLTYDDYSQPGKLVTLPTRLFVALGAPSQLILHYVFDDGPKKVVHSYERMTFDLANGEIRWASGGAKPVESNYHIVSNTMQGKSRRIVFERSTEKFVERQTLELSQEALSLKKEEISGKAPAHFRDGYEFHRAK